MTEVHLHVTDTQVNLTLDEGYKRVAPRKISYVERLAKNKNECKEFQVQIEVSSVGVAGFPLYSLLRSRHFSHTGDAPTPWYRVILEEVVITQRARKSSFCETRKSPPYL
jgi:hypothetical protein